MKATGLITVAFKSVNSSGFCIHFHSHIDIGWRQDFLQGFSLRGAHVIQLILEVPAQSVNCRDSIAINIIQRHLYNSGYGALALHFRKRCHAKGPSGVEFPSLPDL